ncbi:hypothetical protein Aperf_G00000104766 [Anoplocephala perfoliata]
MGGLRRLTLNDNPQIGNSGSKLLCDVLCEDHWIKAIDLQNCGIGDQAGNVWLSLLRSSATGEKGSSSESGDYGDHFGNRTLGIVDLRRNNKLDRGLLRAITERVLANAYGKHIEFNWLRALAKPPNRGRVTDWPAMNGVLRRDLDTSLPPKRVSTTNPNYHPRSLPLPKGIQRPCFKPAGGPLVNKPISRTQSVPRLNNAQPPAQQRSPRLLRPTSGPLPGNSVYLCGKDERNYKSDPPGFENSSNYSIVPGVPWRTAARAKRHTSNLSCQYATVKISQGLLNTLTEMDLINRKRDSTVEPPASSSALSPRSSMISSSSGSAREANTVVSSIKSSSMPSQVNSPESCLRQQLRKHMKEKQGRTVAQAKSRTVVNAAPKKSTTTESRTRMKSDESHSITTPTSEIFIARPGRAFEFSHRSSRISPF